MPIFQSKPKKIRAYQFTEELMCAAVLDHNPPAGVKVGYANTHPERREVYSAKLYVVTIHGQRTNIEIGDWIIEEPDGVHHYPCKPDIFEKSYEPAIDGSLLASANR